MTPKSFSRIAALVLIGLVPVIAPAQAKRLSIVDTFLRQWDADRDGTLSLDEVKKAATARFNALDRDHDGTLDRRELGATVTAWQFRRADADKDRTLDMNEYLAMVEMLFRAADKDHDGTLDRKELNSWAGRFLLRLFGPKQGPIF
jgi:Ca2+-binding EF-hand superfamily protein